MGGNTVAATHHPVLFLADPRPPGLAGRADLHWRAPSQWSRWRLKTAPSLWICRLNRSNNYHHGRLAAQSSRGLTPCAGTGSGDNDLRPALRSETNYPQAEAGRKEELKPRALANHSSAAFQSRVPKPIITVPGRGIGTGKQHPSRQERT